MKKLMLSIVCLFMLATYSQAFAQLCARGDCADGSSFIVGAATDAGCGGDLLIQKCDGKWYYYDSDCGTAIQLPNSNKAGSSAGGTEKTMAIREIEKNSPEALLLNEMINKNKESLKNINFTAVFAKGFHSDKAIATHNKTEAREFFLSLLEGVPNTKEGLHTRIQIYSLIEQHPKLKTTSDAIMQTQDVKNLQVIQKSIAIAQQARSQENHEVKIFPNPASDKLTVQFANPIAKSFTMEIYSLTGAKQFEILLKVGEQTVQIPVQGLALGAYQLRYQVDGKVQYYQFTVQR
jgi:hypothetical protein